MIKDYINLECLALQLDLPKAYLKRQADSRKIPYLLVGGRKRFQEKAVRVALDKIEREVISQKSTNSKRIKQLEKAILSFGKNPAGFDWGVLDKIDELETANEQQAEEIERLKKGYEYQGDVHNRTSTR